MGNGREAGFIGVLGYFLDKGKFGVPRIYAIYMWFATKVITRLYNAMRSNVTRNETLKVLAKVTMNSRPITSEARSDPQVLPELLPCFRVNHLCKD